MFIDIFSLENHINDTLGRGFFNFYPGSLMRLSAYSSCNDPNSNNISSLIYALNNAFENLRKEQHDLVLRSVYSNLYSSNKKVFDFLDYCFYDDHYYQSLNFLQKVEMAKNLSMNFYNINKIMSSLDSPKAVFLYISEKEKPKFRYTLFKFLDDAQRFGTLIIRLKVRFILLGQEYFLKNVLETSENEKDFLNNMNYMKKKISNVQHDDDSLRKENGIMVLYKDLFLFEEEDLHDSFVSFFRLNDKIRVDDRSMQFFDERSSSFHGYDENFFIDDVLQRLHDKKIISNQGILTTLQRSPDLVSSYKIKFLKNFYDENKIINIF